MVSNLFQFGGRGGGYYTGPLEYLFSGGTLNASNIEVTADLIIGSTNNPLVVNPGYFKLGGMLAVGMADLQFGRFILESNAVINFALPQFFYDWYFQDGAGRVQFASSGAEQWNPSALLIVSNWSGAINGGGDDQLKFGNNSSGLSASQIDHIRFVNPAGFPAGTFQARILSTGEVVPNAPAVSAMASGNGLVITWPDDSYTLQSATNVLGPWTNVVSATSPFTNNFGDSPQEFFRLQR